MVVKMSGFQDHTWQHCCETAQADGNRLYVGGTASLQSSGIHVMVSSRERRSNGTG